MIVDSLTWDERGMLILNGEGIEIECLDLVHLSRWVEWKLEVYGRDWAPADVPSPDMPEPPEPVPPIGPTMTGD